MGNKMKECEKSDDTLDKLSSSREHKLENKKFTSNT
jgi:hypothetical protein